MLVKPNLQFKNLKAATPGELVRFQYGPMSPLAIVLRQGDERTFCGVLETENSEPFQLMISEPEDVDVISYGSDWILETVFGPESFLRNNEYHLSHGVVHRNSAGIFLNLARDPGHVRTSAASFDLLSLKALDLRRSSVPFTTWRIWASDEVMKDTRSAPLFEFTAKPQSAGS